MLLAADRPPSLRPLTHLLRIVFFQPVEWWRWIVARARDKADLEV